MVTVNGKKISLLEWADMNGCPRNTVLTYWEMGERDPYKLISRRRNVILPKAIEEPSKTALTADDIEWLKETCFARRGQPDEWEIACELVGLSVECADAVRMALEGV